MDHYANTMNWQIINSEAPDALRNNDNLSEISRKDDLAPQAMDTIRNVRVKNKRNVLSEFDHTKKVVRSNNLIDLFYDARELDSYIAQNLYGGLGEDVPQNVRLY